MDDVVSGQAVKELAHKQVREKYCGMAFKKHRDFYIKLADSIIDLLPSAQPEIIYCKDCGHRDDHGCCKYWKGLSMGEIPIATDDNDFCSHARRREREH